MNKQQTWRLFCKVGIVGLFLSGWAVPALAKVFVDTDYVQKQKGQAGVVLIDTRSEDDYKKGHIPGAINLGGKGAAVVLRDVDARILAVKKYEEILGKAGIGREDEVIVYGTKGDTGPTVAFWILEYLGAPKAKVYHGGYDDWTAAKQPVTNEERKLAAKAFSAKPRLELLATTDYVKANLKNPKVQILDVRTKKEYSGDDIRALRGGHLAGSTNIPYEEAWVDPEASKKFAEKKVPNRDGMALKDPGALKELYKGLDPKKEIVALCQTGTRSTQTYAVLRDLGFQKVRNYDDSWIVWGSDRNLPVENVSYFDFVKVNAAMKQLEALEKRVAALEPKK